MGTKILVLKSLRHNKSVNAQKLNDLKIEGTYLWVLTCWYFSILLYKIVTNFALFSLVLLCGYSLFSRFKHIYVYNIVGTNYGVLIFSPYKWSAECYNALTLIKSRENRVQTLQPLN